MTETTPKRQTLSSILVDAGIVTPEQVDNAFQRQLTTGLLMGETLVEMGFTTEENIGWALSKQLGIPYVDVQPGAVDGDIVRQFPESLLRRVQAAPLFRSQDEIVVAMSDPTDRDEVKELKDAAGMELSLVIGCPASIRRVLDAVYGPERSSVDPAPDSREIRTNAASSDEPGAAPRIVWDRSGNTFLLYHVHAARAAKASEVHLMPSPGGLAVAYRTDRGVERQGMEQPETALYLRSRLAHLGAPDLEAGQSFVQGSAAVQLGAERIHVGVCHCRTDLGVATVLRVSPEPDQAAELSTLGLSPIGEAEIRDFVEGPEGLVIVHGPPRAGGSTVLASLAALAARPDRRTVVFEPWRVTPYPAGTTRVPVPVGSETSVAWDRLAVGFGADVLVLDDVLRGERIQDVLGGATVGRLVFARTDWLDGERLVDLLATSPNGRAVLRDRPFAIITLPLARREGSGVWTTPVEAEGHAGLLEVTLLTEEARDRLFGRGSA